LMEVNTKELGLRKGEFILSKQDAFGTVTQKVMIK